MKKVFDIEDPIEEAFPIAIDAAKRFCSGRNDPNSVCYIYHCLWPRLRRIGSTGLVQLHAVNYINTFRRLASEGSRRILVSGTADYSLISFVLHAFRLEQAEPEITVLDLCQAPLMVNRWYAERHHCRITTVASDIFQYDDKGFDIVTTDNFLTRFDADERNRLVSKWRKLLRPAGKIVTAQRISTESFKQGNSLTVREITSKLDRIRTNARKHADVLDIEEKTLIHDAARYYQQRSYVTINSIEEVCQLFEANSFEVETVARLNAQMGDYRIRASLSRCSEHVYFVAGKTRGDSTSRLTYVS